MYVNKVAPEGTDEEIQDIQTITLVNQKQKQLIAQIKI